ncbi:MAG: T9SS type A sorting domain-containing protein [Rhodothermia bacterium]
MTRRSYQFQVHSFLAFLALSLGAMCPTVANAQGWAVDVDPTIVGIQSSYTATVGSGTIWVDVYLIMWDTTGIGPTPWNAYSIDIEISDDSPCAPSSVLGLTGPTTFDRGFSGLASGTTTEFSGAAITAGAVLTPLGIVGGATGPGGSFCTTEGGAGVLEPAGSFFPPAGVFGPPGTPLLVETNGFAPLAAGVSDVAPIGLFDMTTPVFPPSASYIWPAVAELALVPSAGALVLFPAGTFTTPAPCSGICPGTITVTSAVLPVELTRFDAINEHGTIRLSWETASEQNNAGFEIQRLERVVDPGIPVEDWVAIGYVDGAGTTNNAQTYEYLVDDVQIGRNIFRLKQIDFDGAFEYSDHVEVISEIPGRFVLAPAYPNPFNPTTTVQFAVATDQHVEAVLYDALGKPVRSVYSDDVTANELTTIPVNGSRLSSGVYILRLEGQNFVGTEKLLLVK